MKANPGGLLAPHEVIGRDELIERLWHVLERQGVVLTAERRIGKTSIIRKMQAEPRAGWTPIYRDLEGLSHPLELAEAVLDDLRRWLPGGARVGRAARRVAKALGGTEIGGILKLPQEARADWKSILTRAVELACRGTGAARLLLLWDEVPLFIHDVHARHGAPMAMELLDLLRGLRQSQDRLRIVFTGSIGFPGVLEALRRDGYTNRPTNDMLVVDVPPLAGKDARELAYRCIVGEGLKVDDVNESAAVIAAAAENVPFYVHHLVDGLAAAKTTVTRERIARVLEERLSAVEDPWDLGHLPASPGRPLRRRSRRGDRRPRRDRLRTPLAERLA